MTPEERIAVLEVENASLRQQVVLLQEELAAAQGQIAERERGKRPRPPFVKGNKPRGVGAKAPRRKRGITAVDRERSRRK